MIKDVTYWLNSPPSDNGVYDKLILAAIVQVLSYPNYDKLANDFGSYAQVNTVTNNTTKSRTIEEIALRSAV